MPDMNATATLDEIVWDVRESYPNGFPDLGDYNPFGFRYPIFLQETYWYDRKGRRHLVDEMSADYLKNTFNFLVRSSEIYGMGRVLILQEQFKASVTSGEYFDANLFDEALEQNPREWVLSCPLIKKMWARILEDEPDWEPEPEIDDED